MRTTLKAGPVIVVGLKNHNVAFAMDGTLPNPLESVYGCITGCAAVYAKKACMEMGISEEGIDIELKVVTDLNRAGAIGKVTIILQFPTTITVEQQGIIKESIEKCPVKALIEQGGSIVFVII
ncbi:OsmC family protein [Propionivibrio sp.]|uniref:OsmC family protein n=1 Tax=Propionivibrio sp. TaxID=2212460 RepID=UPI003BF21E1D